MRTWKECTACKGVGTITTVCPICHGHGSWKQESRGFVFSFQCPHCRVGSHNGAISTGSLTNDCIDCNGRQGVFSGNEQDRVIKKKILEAWNHTRRICRFEADVERAYRLVPYFGNFCLFGYGEFRRAVESEVGRGKTACIHGWEKDLRRFLEFFNWKGGNLLDNRDGLTEHLEKREQYLLDAETVLSGLEHLRQAAGDYRQWLIQEIQLDKEVLDEEGDIDSRGYF